MSLPVSRIVNVNVTRQTQFPTRAGFGTILLLTSVAKAGVIDGDTPSRAYASMAEVAADFDATDEAYLMASAAFAQNPSPVRVRIGTTDGTGTATIITDALNAIEADANDFYWICPGATLRTGTQLDGLANWVEPRNKFAIIASSAESLRNKDDVTNVAARNKGEHERVAVMHAQDGTQYPDVALAAVLSTFDFDDPNTAYTAKFKRLAGITPFQGTSADAEAITGFIPDIGQSTDAGHCANIYADHGGIVGVAEGSTLKPNVFIDDIHTADWLEARMGEAVLTTLATGPKVPYDAIGMALLGSAVRGVMQRAQEAGFAGKV